LQAGDFQIKCGESVKLEKPSSLPEAVEELQAVWTEVKPETATKSYQGSLMVVEHYNQGKGVIVFSQEALDALKTKGMGIEQEKKDTFVINCSKEKKTISLISYLISSGFVKEVPPLYVTQAFVEKDANTISIWSYTTESAKGQQEIIKALQTITCIEKME